MSTTDALQTTLTAEHAAVYVLAALAGASRGMAGDRAGDSGDSPVESSTSALIGARHRVHRGRREHLVVLLRSAGADPVAAEAAYTLPARDTPAEVRRAVLDVEQACQTNYAALVASSTDDVRGWAVQALQESAVAALAWGGEPTPFPGAHDLAP